MREHKKLILILIIFCMVFQLIPFTISHIDILHNDTQKLGLQPVKKHIADDVYIGKECQKALNQMFQNKDNLTDSNPVIVLNQSLSNISSNGLFFDQRKSIRQSIPDYFNGSKYL